MDMSIVEEANSMFKERKFADALKLYNQIIDGAPANALAYQGAADCYLNLREFQKAIDLCSQALKLDAGLVMTHVIMAFAYHNLNLTEKGYEQAKIAVGLDSESPDALGCYGTLLLADDKVDEALPFLEKAAQLNPNSYLIHNNLAYAYRKKGDVRNYLNTGKVLYKLKPTFRNAIHLVSSYIESKPLLTSAIILWITLLGAALNMRFLLIIPILYISIGLVVVIRSLITKRIARSMQLAIAIFGFGLSVLVVYLVGWLISTKPTP